MSIMFEVETLIGKIKTTERYWEIIKHKHPEIKNSLSSVVSTLEYPEQIRKSKVDKDVYIFYKKAGKYWLKEGETIWTR